MENALKIYVKKKVTNIVIKKMKCFVIDFSARTFGKVCPINFMSFYQTHFTLNDVHSERAKIKVIRIC